MARFFLSVSLCLLGSASFGATISSSVSVVGCSSGSFSDGPGGQEDFGSFQDSCSYSVLFGGFTQGIASGAASARARYGSIGVATASDTLTPQSADGENGILASARAFFSDAISASIESGTIVIPIDLAGSFSSGEGFQGYPSRYQSYSIFSASVTSGTESYTYNAGVTFDGVFESGNRGVTDFSLPIFGGRAALSAEMFAESFCFSAVVGDGDTLCSTEVDFYASLRFLGARVYDANGLWLQDATLISDSGFDYIAGAEPHQSPTPNPVPLPSSALMLMCGLASLILARWSNVARGMKPSVGASRQVFP